MKKILLVALTWCSITTHAQFTQRTSVFNGVWDGETVLGDLDNDGDLDVILSGSGSIFSTASAIYKKNDGQGNYTDTGVRLKAMYFVKVLTAKSSVVNKFIVE